MADPIGSTSTSRSSSSAGTSNRGEGVVDKVRDTATAQLANQKNRATEGLGSVAQAVRQTTQQLRDQKHETIAQYAEQAADQIERFSQRLRDRDITELMNDVQRMTRNQPVLFVGGAFALGLIGARFFKSSSRSYNRDYPQTSYGYSSEQRQASTGEYRGYAQAGGPGSYASNETSQVHDYQGSRTVGGPDISATEEAGDFGDAESSTSPAAPRTRSRRGPQTERS